MVTLAFYQPDIAANFGAGLRLAACLGLNVDVVEPCGFAIDDRRMKRASMDYGELPEITRFGDYQSFLDAKRSTGSRILLLSRFASHPYFECRFSASDTLLVGRETSGVPNCVAESVDLRLQIPMVRQARSLNVITALAIVSGEAVRQTDGFPQTSDQQGSQ